MVGMESSSNPPICLSVSSIVFFFLLGVNRSRRVPGTTDFSVHPAKVSTNSWLISSRTGAVKRQNCR